MTARGRPRHIIAVTSLAREALIARGNGVSVICSQSCRLSAALKGALSPGVCGIISFGISGGLHPELVAGDWVVASAVRYGDRDRCIQSTTPSAEWHRSSRSHGGLREFRRVCDEADRDGNRCERCEAIRFVG